MADLSKNTYSIDAPILTISEWQHEIILQETGRDSTVIHGGVDGSVFHPCPKPSRQSGRKTIFYILRGPGYTWKGNEDFFQAYERLRARFSGFDITAVAPEGLTFTGSIPCAIKKAPTDEHLARLYGEADLFVYTSYYEAFGLPPLEAMACGTAVVTTDCGGTRDYARSGENCRVVPPSDIGQLTEAIYELLSDDAQREHLARNGYLQAQAWSWQRTAAEVERFLLSL